MWLRNRQRDCRIVSALNFICICRRLFRNEKWASERALKRHRWIFYLNRNVSRHPRSAGTNKRIVWENAWQKSDFSRHFSMNLIRLWITVWTLQPVRDADAALSSSANKWQPIARLAARHCQCVKRARFSNLKSLAEDTPNSRLVYNVERLCDD